LKIVVTGSNSCKISGEDGWEAPDSYWSKIVDCKAGGLDPRGKMTSASFKSSVVVSSYVSLVSGDKSIAAVVDNEELWRQKADATSCQLGA
jgi:hypothetical protein